MRKDFQDDEYPKAGLTSARARELKSAGFGNDWEPKAVRTYLRIVLVNSFSVFNLMIFPLLGILLALGQYKDAISVGGIALLNTLINLFQEIRAKLALERIKLEYPSLTSVIREGAEIRLPVKEIVKGDLMVLRAGERVLADGRVVGSDYLELDESMLTGESDYVGKKVEDQVLAGSFAVAGQGLYLAERLGPETWIQKVVLDSRKIADRRTRLEKQIDFLVRLFIVLCVFIAAVIGIKYSVFSQPAIDPIRFVVASVTSLIPQGLVLIVSLTFALSVIAFARRGIIFKRINAVEGLADINLICMDKTGTLTENEIQFERLIPASTELASPEVESLLAGFAAMTTEKNKTIDALSRAFFEAPSWRRLAEIPFKSKNKFSALRVELGDEGGLDLALGASEILETRLKTKRIPSRIKSELLKAEAQGLRTISLASRPAEEGAFSEEGLHTLDYVALIVFRERLKPEAPEILAGFARRGVRQVVISGDSLLTVKSLARQLNLEGAEGGLTGSELAEFSSLEFEERVLACNVFARVQPEQKKEIIRVFQKAGYRVAMIGDGVNDVLALKESNLSIAMGSGGSMAKEVSDLVLVNNRFDLLPDLLKEGEKIITRLRDSARIFSLKNSYALILILVSLFLGLSFPFYPQQITMINFVTITIPLLYIVKYSNHSSQVEGNFVKNILKFSFSAGSIIALSALAVEFLVVDPYPGYELEVRLGMLGVFRTWFKNPALPVQTATIIPIVLLASGVFLGLGLAKRPNFLKGLGLAVLIIGLLTIFFGVIYLPPLAEFFEFVPLDLKTLFEIGLVTLGAFLILYIVAKCFLGFKRGPDK